MFTHASADDASLTLEYQRMPTDENKINKADKPTVTTLSVALQQRRQAFVMSLMWGLPIVMLELLGPVLQSSDPGAHVWWRVMQGLLCGMVLYSPAGGPLLAEGVVAMRAGSPSAATLLAAAVLLLFAMSVLAIVIPALRTNGFWLIAALLAVVQYVLLRRAQRTLDAARA